MKKRLLSALLALALVFVLLPTTALAGETTYSDSEITISGKYWNFGKKGTSGEYAPVYFRSNGTAFEESKPTGSNYLEIKKTGEKEITITVYGTVNLTENESSTNSCISVNSNGVNERNLIITGAAKGSTLNLTCKNNSHPLYSYEGSITINGGVTVNATSQCSNNNNYVSVYGIQVYKGGHNLTISGANTKVNVANKTYDSTVKVDGNITVSDGAQLKAENKSGKVTGNTSKKAYAIECGGQFSISGDKTQVTADTSNGKKAISGTVNNGDKLTFKAANSKGSQIFLQRPMDEALGYAYVEITQAPTDPYVLINGQYAIIGQETPIPGGTGTYLYKKTPHDGSFLTLKGVDITGTKDGPARFIQFGKNGGYYTIQLEGENKISGFSSGIVAPEDPGVNDVTVVLSGSGSLDITANQYAIDMQVGNLKFENTGEIKLTTGYVFTLPLNALRVKSGSIIIDNTKYDIVGVKQDKDGTREDISDNPNLDTILKGTSTDKDLYFKSITITPAAAKPSTISYNGKTLKQGETITDGNGGTATVDSENNTITLNNFNGTALSFDATLADSTLVLEGTNTLSSIVTTQMGLTISGSGSLTVGSIRVTNNDNISADLTITGGAHVTVNRPSEDKPAVEVSGNLTVTGEGTQLSAECTAATNPAIEVGGNVTISGNPGTNAYTVKAYNKYDTPRDRDDKLRPSQMPSAFEISGNLSISGSAQVMAQTDSDGAAVWMPKEKVISVVDASLIAQNSSHNFSTISFGDGSDMGNIYAKGQVNIVAENMLHSSSSLAHRAIKAFIYNHYSTGDSNPYYINVVSEGVQSGGKVNVIPGHCTSTGGYKVTITRGDAYSAPTTISRIIITGLTPPVKGETPVTTGVSLGTGLTVTEVTWGGTFTSDGEFKADESYTAHIKYTVDAGYMLATDAQCQDISAADTVRLNKSESQVEVTFHTGGGSTHQHVEGPWEADTQGGHHIKKCTECGEVMISEEHIYRYAYESPTTHKVNCGVCGVNFVRAHSYTDSYVPTVDGTQHHGKCICGAEETTLRDHVFVNGVCVCGVTQSGGDPTPDVPAAPTGLVGVAPTSENGNGKITGTTAQMEYATSLEGDWTACANDSTDVPAGKYYVRMKKTDNTPAGEAVEVTVPAYSGTGELEPPTPDNPGTIVIIRPAEEEKPAQQPNPSTGANDLVGLAVAAAVAAALGSAALLRKHD